MKTRKILLISGLILAVLFAAAAAVVFLCWLPYKNAESSFISERRIALYQQQDGTVRIVWPEGENTDQYLLEIVNPQSQQTEYSARISQVTEHIIPALSQDRACIIRISTLKDYRFPIEKKVRQRLGKNPIQLQDVFTVPKIQQVRWMTNAETGQATAVLTLAQGCSAGIYEVPESGEPIRLQDISGNEITLSFGREGMRPLPPHGQPYVYAFDVCRQGAGYTYYGVMEHHYSLNRQALLGTNLIVQEKTEDDGRRTLTWNETKGDGYTVQKRTGEKQPWEDVAEIAVDGNRSYTTGCLTPYSTEEYRVIARRDGDDSPIAQSETVSVETASVVIYSTIWPVSDLTIYSDAQKSQTLGTASKGKAFCVLGLENDMFRIRYQNGYGFINSNYCLINLPDFLGDLCSYNITNSYNSLYKIHKFDIPKVTGKVITGYEKIQQSGGSYLVPLLYPTAKKLEKAALSAQKEGYTILIYDAFRPQSATKFLYDTAWEFSKKPVPDEDVPEDWNQIPEDEEAEPKPYTYALYMTNRGKFAVGNFLAQGRSNHNLGVAMDMTLVKNGSELEMQTKIHDLSWYSASYLNNANAKELSRIMKNAGFGGLTSEWWHYQDNETISQFKPSALWAGVTQECWVSDGIGWRYRCADGSYYKNKTVTVDGQSYSFDADGYATEQK